MYIMSLDGAGLSPSSKTKKFKWIWKVTTTPSKSSKSKNEFKDDHAFEDEKNSSTTIQKVEGRSNSSMTTTPMKSFKPIGLEIGTDLHLLQVRGCRPQAADQVRKLGLIFIY